jgi:hypothetical protein
MRGSWEGFPGNGKLGLARITTPSSAPARYSLTIPEIVNASTGGDDGADGRSDDEGADGDVVTL